MFCNKDCKKCNHFVTDFREYAGKPQPEKVAKCVFQLIYDELKNMNTRNAMIHSELGEVKNATIFEAIATLTDSAEAKEETRRLIERHFKTNTKAALPNG